MNIILEVQQLNQLNTRFVKPKGLETDTNEHYFIVQQRVLFQALAKVYVVTSVYSSMKHNPQSKTPPPSEK